MVLISFKNIIMSVIYVLVFNNKKVYENLLCCILNNFSMKQKKLITNENILK